MAAVVIVSPLRASDSLPLTSLVGTQDFVARPWWPPLAGILRLSGSLGRGRLHALRGEQKRHRAERERFAVEHADEIAAVGFEQAWYSQESFRVGKGQSWRGHCGAAMADDSGTDAADRW